MEFLYKVLLNLFFIGENIGTCIQLGYNLISIILKINREANYELDRNNKEL